MRDLRNLLNKEQYEAVTTIEGPSLILAGAGSGKTRVITYKIANLLNKGIPADKILAVTFTNKAAKEMKNRVSQLVKSGKKNLIITTFHSLGVRILKKDIPKLGYRSKFSIYDEQDSIKLIKDVVKELKIADDQYDVMQLKYLISRIKMNPSFEIFDKVIKEIHNRYQENLKLYNAVDFDDLIRLPIKILQKDKQTLQKYQKKWKYILVDEYQDTSFMQYELMRLLAKEHKNISVVGDDDQSIYSWRGANPQNMSKFEKDFYPVKEIRLEQNYRSTKNILNAANEIIKVNTTRKEKNLWTTEGAGDKIILYHAIDESDEANFVASTIQHLTTTGYRYKDFGILFRMNSLSRHFEEKLRENNIPYKIVGGMKFFDRPEVRDIVAYIRFLANQDDEVALHRIINTPRRGIGKTTLHKVIEYAKKKKSSLYSAIKDSVKLGLAGSKMTPYLEDFVNLIEKYKEMIFKPKNIGRSIKSLVEEIDYNAKLILDLKVARKVRFRMNNIESLINSIYKYENDPDNFNPNLFEYLQKISLTGQDDDEKTENQVNMMSIHSAKGLEFKVVFLVGLEDELLPHSKTIEETGNDEEERRLFYVAITRAREKLYFTYPRERMKFSQVIVRKPSIYIKEIPEELIETMDEEDAAKNADDKLEEFMKKIMSEAAGDTPCPR